MQETGIQIHTDGGARGNPGPAAAAFTVSHLGKKLHQEAKYLGKTTNNFAEYQGAILALKWLSENEKEMQSDKVTFFLDSELIVRQINGIYKVKDETLKKLHAEVKSLMTVLTSEIIFKNVRREQNKDADFLVNETLDENSKSFGK
jgi:ribonuclease HI